MDLNYILQVAKAAPLPLRSHAAKEAVQRCLLAKLQEHGILHDVAFIGGTALRLLHGLPRYSEDLDFIWVNPSKPIDLNEWATTLKSAFKGQNITIHLDKKPPEKVDALVEKYSATIYFLATSSAFESFARNGLQISFEIDLNPPDHFVKETKPMTVAGKPIPISSLTLPSLMAGKLHILLTRIDREKGRDWFDYAWYRRHNVSPNVDQLRSAIAQTASGPDGRYWMSFLRKRTVSVNWENIRNDVRPFLENQADEKLLCAQNMGRMTPWPDFEAILKEVRIAQGDHMLLKERNPVIEDVEQAALEGELPAIDVLSAIKELKQVSSKTPEPGI